MSNQPNMNPNAPFTMADGDNIKAIIEAQPLQNMQAARAVSALVSRFVQFCAKNLAPQAAEAAKGPKLPEGGKKGKGNGAGDAKPAVDPLA